MLSPLLLFIRLQSIIYCVCVNFEFFVFSSFPLIRILFRKKFSVDVFELTVKFNLRNGKRATLIRS